MSKQRVEIIPGYSIEFNGKFKAYTKVTDAQRLRMVGEIERSKGKGREFWLELLALIKLRGLRPACRIMDISYGLAKQNIIEVFGEVAYREAVLAGPRPGNRRSWAIRKHDEERLLRHKADLRRTFRFEYVGDLNQLLGFDPQHIFGTLGMSGLSIHTSNPQIPPVIRQIPLPTDLPDASTASL